MANLRFLILENNKITKLPEEIVGLENLEGLYLNHNQITELPTNIYKLKSLKKLNLYNNQLTILPKKIFKLKSLENLNLYGNPIKSINKKMYKLKNLREFDVKACKELNLASLFTAFKKSKNRIAINLTGRESFEKPYSLLIKVDIKDTLINEIEFLSKNLVFLNLKNSDIKTVPASLEKLQALEQIHINYSRLKDEDKKKIKAILPKTCQVY